MEDKNPGQTPDASITHSDDATAQRTAPLGDAKPLAKEDAVDLARGEKRAKADNAAMSAAGFGDHKGTEGF
jgi:hypothetical protein